MTRPARNAPKASDAPAATDPRAVRVPTMTSEIRHNSLLRGLRISSSARGALAGSAGPAVGVAPHRTHSADGDPGADGNEQRDDAGYRQALDLVHVGHQAQCVGAGYDARGDDPRGGGALDAMEHQDDE